MYNPILFKDRAQAGRKLAQELKKLKIKNPVVLAVPSGGVPVGLQIAKTLKCPFDLVLVRKIQFPWTTEAGFGAVAPDGTSYLGPAANELTKEMIKIQTKKALEEVRYRQKEFLKGREKVNVKNKTAILIDDGLATGSTMFAAIKSVKKEKPKKVIVATPTASGNAIQLIKPQVDKLIVLYIHPRHLPFAVASSYEKWHDLTDKEVKKYLP